MTKQQNNTSNMKLKANESDKLQVVVILPICFLS